MGLVSKFWLLLSALYAKLSFNEQKADFDVNYVQARTSNPLASIRGSKLAVVIDAMYLLYIRSSPITQSPITTLEGYTLILLDTLYDLVTRDLRVEAIVVLFDKDTPSGKNEHKKKSCVPLADPNVPSGHVGEPAWQEFFDNYTTEEVKRVGDNNHVSAEKKLTVTPEHMGNRGFKQFLISAFCRELQKKREVFAKRKGKPLTICVRGHNDNNFELYWDGKSDSVICTDCTLFKGYYKEAEMATSAVVCDLITQGYCNIAVFSEDHDAFGPLAMTIPLRTNADGNEYTSQLYWITRTQVFNMNSWHQLEERFFQSLGLEYSPGLTLVHYIAFIIGGGNDYVKKLTGITANAVLEACDADTYASLLHITHTDDTFSISVNALVFERLVQQSYAAKRAKTPDAEAIAAMHYRVQWYMDYLAAGFIAEPAAFPSKITT